VISESFGEREPEPNNEINIWESVLKKACSCNDELKNLMIARSNFGVKKYGTPLQAFNGRNALQDVLEEALDLIAYCEQVCVEKKEKKSIIKNSEILQRLVLQYLDLLISERMIHS